MKRVGMAAALFAAMIALFSGCGAAKDGDAGLSGLPIAGLTDASGETKEQAGITVPEAKDPVGETEKTDSSEDSVNVPDDGITEPDDEIVDFDDEIVNPDEFEEIEVHEAYEDGDWKWAKLQNGTWRAAAYKGSGENVEIPDSFRDAPVTEVGVWCFRDNTSLKSVAIPKSVVVIDENCFMGCTNLESVQMPPHLEFMGDQTFSGCKSLKRAVVPDGVKELDYRQFDECESLTEVVLPASLTLIGEAAFRHCRSLKTIYYRGGEADWNGIKIYSNALADSVYDVVTDYGGK